MNRWINFLDRKIGKYAIERLPLYMVICYGIGFIMNAINPDIINIISLNPYAIVHGQVWRLVTWLLIPPGGQDIFFLITLYFYYVIGMRMERTWGAFYFNYYIFSGIIFTIIGAFCLYGYTYLFTPDVIEAFNIQYIMSYGEAYPEAFGQSAYFGMLSSLFSTYYINMSIFLAYAVTYPEMQILLMFFIPVKMKVMGIIYAIVLVLAMIQMGAIGVFVIGASMVNFVVFYMATLRNRGRTIKNFKRQREFKKKMQPIQRGKISKHKCAICGRTDEEYPNLEFRFCSKCEGNYEYCQEHLFTHKHIKRD